MKNVETVSVFDQWLTSRLENVHTSIPAKIVEYNGHKLRTATVKPLLKFKNQYGVITEIEPIPDVPVQFPGGKNMSMLWKPEKDDGCLLQLCSVDIANFLNGDGTTETEAETSNKFKLSDAICLLGVWAPKGSPTKPANEDDFFLNYKDCSLTMDGSDFEIKNKTATISSDGGDLKINGDADFVTKYNEMKTAFDQLKSDFDSFITIYNTHIHVTTATVLVGPVGIISPTTATGSPSTADMTNAKSSTVKVP